MNILIDNSTKVSNDNKLDTVNELRIMMKIMMKRYDNKFQFSLIID